MKKLLFAGASGFIGTFLLKNLKNKYSTSYLSRSKGLDGDNFFPIDLTNEEEISRLFEYLPKCNTLIFLVGLAHKKGKNKEIDEFRRINKQTLINLLSVLGRTKKLPEKIIFFSTISVYGESIKQNEYNEDSRKIPLSPYAVTKLEAEEYLQKNYGKRSCILRIAPVYASNFSLNIERRTKIWNWFYKVADGNNKLSLCNLENIGIVVNSIIEDKVPPSVYNISDNKIYSYNDILKDRKAELIIKIPKILAVLFLHFGNVVSSIFIKESLIKLTSDNIFPSKKIRQFIDLPYTLSDLNNYKSGNIK